jgi:hypothetical protein
MQVLQHYKTYVSARTSKRVFQHRCEDADFETLRVRTSVIMALHCLAFHGFYLVRSNSTAHRQQVFEHRRKLAALNQRHHHRNIMNHRNSRNSLGGGTIAVL